MDTVNSLPTLVEEQILKFVSGAWYKIRVFTLFDRDRQSYAILALPDEDYPIPGVRNRIELLVHLKDDHIIIEIDLSDKPFYEWLLHADIPRSQIILAYAGETIAEA